MSELIPQDGYRPVINPYYKCFTDVKFDPVISSIIFFNRFIKQPVGYLDVTKFTKAADLTNVSLEVDSTGKHWLIFQRRHAPAISIDVSDLYTVVDDKLSPDSTNAIQNKVVVDKLQQILSNTLGFQSDLNILSDTYNSLDEVDSTKYRENDTIQIYDNVTSAVSYYTLVDGNFILTPRKDAAFVSTSNVDALGNSFDPEQSLSADNRVPSSKLLKYLLDFKADKSILSNYVSFIELPTREVLSALNVSYLSNDAGYITSADIPEYISSFKNDTGYITSSDAKTQIEDYHYITSSDIPENISYFKNDVDYIVLSDIPFKLSEYINDVGYISKISSLTFTKDGKEVGKFDGTSNLSVDLTQEQQLSGGRLISITDNIIDSTLSIVGEGDIRVADGIYSNKVIISANIPKKVSDLRNDANYISKISSLTFTKDGEEVGKFDGTSNLSVDLTQEIQPQLSAKGRYLSIDNDYTIYSTLSVEAADDSISVNEDGDAIKLSVPKKQQQDLMLVKNGVSSIYNGESAVVVNLATELSAGENISIVDNKINCTLSVNVPLSVSQLENDIGYISKISSLTFTKDGEEVGKFDGTSNLSVDLTQEIQPQLSAKGRYLSIDNNYTIYNTLSVEAADDSISVNEDGDTIKLSVPKKLQQNLTLVKNGVSSIYNGESAVVVDIDVPLSVSQLENDASYITGISNLTFIKDGEEVGKFDGTSALSVDLTQEIQPQLSAGENISIVDNKINCTLSVDVPLSVSQLENDASYITGISNLTFIKDGEEVGKFDGTSNLSVDLTQEQQLSGGRLISIDDNIINCNLSVASAGDACVTLSDYTYVVSVDVPKQVSQFENDAQYIPRSALSTLLSNIVLSADTFNQLMLELGEIIKVFGGKLCIDFDEK